MAYIVEKDWITSAGLRAVVIMVDNHHRCGYVGVPKDNLLYGKSYNDMTDPYPDVHGGLTYSDNYPSYPVESDLWWFGYDCNHDWDAPSPEYLEANPDARAWVSRDQTHKTVGYCIGQCEDLANQLKEYKV